MLKQFIISALALTAALSASAQMTATPFPTQEDSKDVVVYYHADQGNKALKDLPASTPLYAHTGVITSLSKSDSDWKSAPKWGDNDPKYAMEYVEPNLYKLYIGDIRTYYGIKSATETIKKMAFVIRTADSKTEGKGTGNKDMFIELSDAGLQIALMCDLDGTIITPETATVNFTLGSTEPANLSMSINGERVAEKANSTELKFTYTFTEPGQYTIFGNAEIDGSVKSTNMKLFYATPSPKADYPGGVPRQGAVRNADGSVTFCLAAPEKTSASIIGSWNDYAETDDCIMSYQDYQGFRYFWKTIEGLDADTMYPYYYLVDNKHRVGDPYAKLILDPYNDKYINKEVFPDLPEYPQLQGIRNVMMGIYWENVNKYDWKDSGFKRPDKNDLVIYELLLRDFTGTEGKSRGNGTLRQAMEKIPYLKKLGVNVIELLPINEFNGNNSWGYNPNFYFAPDKAYGTPDDYKDFISLCHENGMAVVLDIVFNQSDGLHPWYQLYDPGFNPFYNLDAPHAYSVLNDWNQGYPLVRQQWYDCVKYWIEEYHVDGYRFDLVKGLGDNDSYANNGDSGTNAYNASRVKNMRDIQKAIEEVAPDAFFINENLAGAQEENEMAQTGMLNWANVNSAGCQFAMGYQSNSNLNRFNAEKDGRTWNSTVSYLESHDEQRLAYQQDTYGADGVKGNHAVSMRRLGSAAAQMILEPGAHMIWQFSEMGNAQSTKSDQGNNTSPKIVNWALLDDPDNKGLYDNYCELISLRLSNPEIFTKDAFNNTLSTWLSPRVIKASNATKELVCMINPLIDKAVTGKYSFLTPDQNAYTIASKSYGTNPEFNVTEGTITIPANSYVVIINNKVDSVDKIDTDGADPLISARGINGAIVVENAPAGYEIYSINGQKIAASAAVTGEVSVASGAYIVRSGNETAKVLVR